MIDVTSTTHEHAARPSLRVAISQRFLPHYRLAFFDELNARLEELGGSLRVFFSYELGKLDIIPKWAHKVPAARTDMQLGELEDSAVVTPGLFVELVRFAPDVVILEDLGGLPNSLLGAVYCRTWHRPYLIWGLGEVPRKRRSRLRKAFAPAIRFLYAGAAGFLCYSTHAARVYRQYKKPTYVAPNSYVCQPSTRDVARVESAIASRYGGDQYRIVSIGTLRRQKRYDVLVAAIAKLQRNAVLHLIGDGPETQALQQLAANLGVADRIVFHGAIYDRVSKAAVLSAAHIGVIPGRGGLAIQEMMAHGVPVISGVADGTEQDLITDGVTGYLLDGFPTVDNVAESLERFFSLEPTGQLHMARAALRVVADESNTRVMADAALNALVETAKAWRSDVVCMVGAFPPPVHGMAVVNATIRDRLTERGRPPLVFDVAAQTLDRSMTKRIGRVRRVGRALLALGTELATRRVGTMYLSVSGGWGQLYDVPFVAMARLTGARVFLHHHSFAYLDARTWPARLLTAVAGSRANHVVLAEVMERRLRGQYPTVATSLVVSNAAITARVASRPRTDLRTIGFLGNISRAKGIPEVLAVAERIAEFGIETSIAGPFESAAMRSLVEGATAKSPAVRYVGPKYGADKNAFWNSIDVLLFPSTYVNEAAPLVVYEALANGVPVIAWDRGCLRDMVTSDVGMLIPRDDDFVDTAIQQLIRWQRNRVDFEKASRGAASHFAGQAAASEQALVQLLDDIASANETDRRRRTGRG